jgi:hypothetical protein
LAPRWTVGRPRAVAPLNRLFHVIFCVFACSDSCSFAQTEAFSPGDQGHISRGRVLRHGRNTCKTRAKQVPSRRRPRAKHAASGRGPGGQQVVTVAAIASAMEQHERCVIRCATKAFCSRFDSFWRCTPARSRQALAPLLVHDHEDYPLPEPLLRELPQFPHHSRLALQQKGLSPNALGRSPPGLHFASEYCSCMRNSLSPSCCLRGFISFRLQHLFFRAMVLRR